MSCSWKPKRVVRRYFMHLLSLMQPARLAKRHKHLHDQLWIRAGFGKEAAL